MQPHSGPDALGNGAFYAAGLRIRSATTATASTVKANARRAMVAVFPPTSRTGSEASGRQNRVGQRVVVSVQGDGGGDGGEQQAVGVVDEQSRGRAQDTL